MVSAMDKARKMRYAKIASEWERWGPIVTRLAALCLAIVLVACGGQAARAASPIPLFSGPQDNSQLFLYLNSLVTAINAINGPLLPPVQGGVNNISLTGGVTGSPATIGLQPGSDPNGGIQINPNGSGNITLFTSGDTGVLAFGSTAVFAQATGLAACPAITYNRVPFGVQPNVQGYVLIQDWLGRRHGIPAC